MDWLDLLAVQGTLKSLLQHHSSKASILRHSACHSVDSWGNKGNIELIDVKYSREMFAEVYNFSVYKAINY